jgi:hypothetical protein
MSGEAQAERRATGRVRRQVQRSDFDDGEEKAAKKRGKVNSDDEEYGKPKRPKKKAVKKDA